MADEILFAGGRLDSLTFTGTPVESTTAGSFDSTYADCSTAVLSTDVITATLVTLSGGVLTPTTVVTGETGYFHFEVYSRTGSTVTLAAALYDSSGFPWLAIRNTALGTWGLYYNSGTGASPTWTQIGSSWAQNNVTKNTYDIKVTLGSPHSVELSRDGSVLASGSWTQASFTNVRSLRGTGNAAGGSQNQFSQILITRGISTINGKVKYARATGAGTNTGWTGAAANVNEAVNSDVTVDSAASAGLKQSYAMTDVTVPTGFVIKSVFHWLRAKNDGAAPQNIKSLIRSGGTDYSSTNISGLGTSFGPVGSRYDTDPATSATWTQSGWNAAEAGYESAT